MSSRMEDESAEDCLMFANPEQKLRRTAIVGVLLLAGLVMGCQEETKRTEVEIGPNTLRSRERMQTQRIEAVDARRRESLEAQKERRRRCTLQLEGRRECS